MKPSLVLTIALTIGSNTLRADEPQRLQESLRAGDLFQVSCRVEISGNLVLPADKENPSGKQLPVKGVSAIDYDERIVKENNGRVDRTIRSYRRMDFERKVGEQMQQSSLRFAVRLQVLMRHDHFEVPFSPNGPLTWGEIDLVRTDVFTPALRGLLPTIAVKPGDRWQADNASVQELTDLGRIDQGTLTCTFETVTTLAKRSLARVTFKGEVKGIGEDGPSRHELEGYYFFDLDARHLSYLYVRGSQHLADKAGKGSGRIDGSFVLTRQPLKDSRDLSDGALQGVDLEPNDDNTLLLYDNLELGVRFLYPRNWRVAGVSGRQIALDEKRGSGLLITLEPLTKLPTGSQFRKETQDWLSQQKATIHRSEPSRFEQSPPNQVEKFSFEADIEKQRVVMEYFVLRQSDAGATLAARLLPQSAAMLEKDLGRMVRSMRLVNTR